MAAIGGDEWYSHTPVVALSTAAWTTLAQRLGGTGQPTVLAVTGSPAWDSVAADTGTTASTPLASLTALSTFRSEIGSLALMIAMLFGVSALVVGAFFTVWTMQRSADIAVLKALGREHPRPRARRPRSGVGGPRHRGRCGIGLTALLGAVAGGTLPFVLSPLTTLAPAAVMIALGLLGAAVSLRTVTSSDPLTALGSTR